MLWSPHDANGCGLETDSLNSSDRFQPPAHCPGNLLIRVDMCDNCYIAVPVTCTERGIHSKTCESWNLFENMRDAEFIRKHGERGIMYKKMRNAEFIQNMWNAELI